MNHDEMHELAALYALDLLEGKERDRFETELSSNEEAAKVLREYATAVDAVALTADAVAPPESLEQRIFGSLPLQAPEENRIVEKGKRGSEPVATFPAWIPWGIAAVLALCSLWLWNERALYREQVAERDAEILQLESDSALQNLRIAVLRSKLEDAPNAEAVAVWNDAQQSGRLTVSSLPEAPADKDYQLWIFDPAFDSPVSAGVFNTQGQESYEYLFTGLSRISSINAFALSVEDKGGSATPQGPVVMVSE